MKHKQIEFNKCSNSQKTNLIFPNDSSYVNINRLVMQSKNSCDKNYVNIKTYIDIEKTGLNSNNPIHIYPHFETMESDDDSDYSCEEIGDPGKNYHLLDCRKNKFKKQNAEAKTSFSLDKFNFSDEVNPWTRQDLTKSLMDYDSHFQHMIYADLVINNQSIPENENIFNLSPKRKINLKCINYLDIDFKKTQALGDMDNELEKMKKSEISKNTYSLKMQSFVSVCHRMMNSVKNVRKSAQKNKKPSENLKKIKL